MSGSSSPLIKTLLIGGGALLVGGPLAGSLLGQLGIGGTAAAGGTAAGAAVGATSGIAAGTVAGGGIAAAGASSATLLSTGLSAAAGLSTFAGGLADARSLETQAETADFNARQATLEGRRQAVEALSQANDQAARNAVVDASRGITGVGTPQVSAAADRERMRSQLTLIRLGGAAQSAASRGQASGLRQQSRTSRTQGIVGGLAQFGVGALSNLER